MSVMEELCHTAARKLMPDCDIRLLEIHHTKKKDAPSGSAVTLCRMTGLDPEDRELVQSLRMGTVFGEHTVYFAMEDEVLEIKHTALSKRIFAIGALEAGKRLMKY
jgi:4-hydroxy-tetrahydrodipicolinate reductase